MVSCFRGWVKTAMFLQNNLLNSFLLNICTCALYQSSSCYPPALCSFPSCGQLWISLQVASDKVCNKNKNKQRPIYCKKWFTHARPGSLWILRCSLFDCLLPWTTASYTRASVGDGERELLLAKHIYDCAGARIQTRSCSIASEDYLCFKTQRKQKFAMPFRWESIKRNCHLEKSRQMFPLCVIPEKCGVCKKQCMNKMLVPK